MKELIMDRWLDSITDLDLSSTMADDEVVQVLALKLYHLKVFSIASTKVTGVGVKALVSKPGEKLEFLNVRNCNAMYNDAIVFARLQGIQVAFGWSSDSKKTGKKIRLE